MTTHRAITQVHSRALSERYDLLSEAEQQFLRIEGCMHETARHTLEFLGKTPYPIDPGAAIAIQWAIQNRVVPWSAINGHVFMCFCDHVHANDEFGKYADQFQEELWWDDPKLQNDLAELEEYVLDLTARGIIECGKFLTCNCVPLAWGILRHIPLIKGKWLSIELLKLVEWGGLLVQNGFKQLPPLDRHSLAMERFYANNADSVALQELNYVQLDELRAEAASKIADHLTGVKQVEGIPCVRLTAYLEWPQRSASTLPVDDGVLARSWEKFARNDGQAIVGDFETVKLGELPPCDFKEGHDFAVVESPAELAVHRANRARVAEGIQQLGHVEPVLPAFDGFLLQWAGKECSFGNTDEYRFMSLLIENARKSVSHNEISDAILSDDRELMSGTAIRQLKRRVVIRLKLAKMEFLAESIETSKEHYGLMLP